MARKFGVLASLFFSLVESHCFEEPTIPKTGAMFCAASAMGSSAPAPSEDGTLTVEPRWNRIWIRQVSVFVCPEFLTALRYGKAPTALSFRAVELALRFRSDLRELRYGRRRTLRPNVS